MEHYHHTPPHKTDVIVRETPPQDKTPMFIFGTSLAILLAGGIFYLGTLNDDDRHRDVANRPEIRVEAETNIETDTPDRVALDTHTVEIRELRSNADALQANESNEAELAAYRARVASLENRIQASQNDPNQQQEIASELSSLRSDYSKLQSQAADATLQAESARVEAAAAQETAADAEAKSETLAFTREAETRLEEIEERLESIEQGPQGGQLAIEIKALNDEAETLIQQLNSVDSNDVMSPTVMQQMNQTLANLEGRLANLTSSISSVEVESR